MDISLAGDLDFSAARRFGDAIEVCIETNPSRPSSAGSISRASTVGSFPKPIPSGLEPVP